MESMKQIDNEIKNVQIVTEEIQFKNDETIHSEKKKMNKLLFVFINIILSCCDYFCFFNWIFLF